MHVSDFDYELPEELIARYPEEDRAASRLLALNGVTGELSHGRFRDVLEKLAPGDLLVMNNTRVLPARLYGRKASGGKLEILVERLLDEDRARVHLKCNRAPRPGDTIYLGDVEPGIQARVEARHEALFELCLTSGDGWMALLQSQGHMPLPPYIDRPDEISDQARYQTVYAERDGAVAAPTAGLHFDEELLAELKARGVDQAFVTLHVGAGTFQSVRVERVEDHHMHAEYIEVPATTVRAVEATRRAGGRVVAVGTTSVRSLESAVAAGKGALVPFQGESDIFIYPGYRFQVVDALITNFHLPQSTLIMLVSAFAGYGQTLAAYRAAVDAGYRFFSYGDAMFITHNPGAYQETPA